MAESILYWAMWSMASEKIQECETCDSELEHHDSTYPTEGRKVRTVVAYFSFFVYVSWIFLFHSE